MKKKDLHRGAGFLKSLLVCGALALALLVFPSFKVNAADNCTISSKEAWADKELVEVHDLKINEKGSLTLSNVYLKVTGNVIANGDITLTNKSRLEVKGDVISSGNITLSKGGVLEVNGTLLQEKKYLDVQSGSKIIANGDLRIQQKNALGEYVEGNSRLESRAGSTINVRKNLIIETSSRLSTLEGTFYVNGNISFKTSDINKTPYTKSTFNLTSSSPQTITLSPNIALGTLSSACKTVNVTKYINVTALANDITFTNSERKIYTTSGLKNTKLLTYDGDLIIDIDMPNLPTLLNDVGGTINVKGDMLCKSGAIDIKGNLNVEKSFLFEEINDEGNAVSVKTILYPRKDSIITVGKDFIWNNIKKASDVYGTLFLSGDYIDKKGISWNGTVKLLSKGQHVTILNGGYIKNLELAYPRSEYFFNPDECWKNIVEPVPTETPSTTNPAVNNDTTAKDEPVVEKLDSSQKQVKITKLTAAKKKVTVTFKKSKKISGYEVQYDTTKKFNNPTTKNVGAKKTSLTIKKLKSKTTYFVRIRSYKTTAEGKVYSTWSKVKKVKVK